MPPTLTDLAVRDRRWCQGNLQHAAVLPTRGLYAISRLHLLTGIGSYITAPLWLLFILTGILIAVQARFVQPDYFPQGKSLFPQWPVIDPVRAMWMFTGTMGLLLVPKLLGCVAILLHRRERRGCGGVLRLFLGLLLETFVAGLMAPVVMLTQSIDVAAILLGRDLGWSAQRRGDGAIPATETRRVPAAHDAWAAAWGGCLARLVVSGAVDAAGGAGARACNPACAADRPAVVRRRPVAHARGSGAATGGRTGRGVAT